MLQHELLSNLARRRFGHDYRSPFPTQQSIFTWINWERCVNFLLALYFLRFACTADLTEAFCLSTFLMPSSLCGYRFSFGSQASRTD
jgi:hypothetical protein